MQRLALMLAVLMSTGQAQAIVLDTARNPETARLPDYSDGPFAGVGLVSSPAGTCSGTAVGVRLVVTAAHCAGGGAGPVSFRLPYSDGAPVERVGRATLYPGFEPGIDPFEQRGNPDIAVLRFDEPLPTSVPLAILPSGPGVLLDTAFEMVGYGDTGDGRTGAVPDDEATPVKRFALNVVERESGQGDRFTAEFDPPGEGSLGPLEGTIGPGDSGGPAFVTDALLAALAEAGGGPVEYMPTTGERVLIGAVSYMTVPRAEQPFGTYGSGAVYTALWPLAEWIAGFDIDVTLVPTTSACGIVACRSSAGPGLTTGGTAAPVPLGGSLGFLAAALVVLSAWTGRARARSRSQSRFEAG